MKEDHVRAVLEYAITDGTEEDEQVSMLVAERAIACAEIEHNKPVRFCPGPGWPVFLVRSMREFDRLQKLSHRGVKHARTN